MSLKCILHLFILTKNRNIFTCGRDIATCGLFYLGIIIIYNYIGVSIHNEIIFLDFLSFLFIICMNLLINSNRLIWYF